MPDMIYHGLIQPKGAGYRVSQLKEWSHYLEPVSQDPARLSGNSRMWGDASPEVQSRVIDALVDASREAGLGVRDTAHVLAIARIESGFNPDAAAGSSSASGIGQFIDKTGRSYGLNEANRFEVDAQAAALVAHFIDNRTLAQRRGQDEAYIYKYHHDGPTTDYGGLALSRDKVLPLLDDYARFVERRFDIKREDAARPPTESAISRNSQEAPVRVDPLRPGQRGSGIADLQAALAELGFTDARNARVQADGMFGPRTGEAVRAFQHAQGLAVDGIVGPDTREALARAQQRHGAVAHDASSATARPVETLLAAARGGDPAIMQAALDDFASTRFGQLFQQSQRGIPSEPDRSALLDMQAQSGPER
ncbi:peptidoglycan-binding protein [Luteimonas sp. 100069]|uniref:peptidoglycan-binding domain-containing protein n=1 Tax=Luteimonas sp. 100069 TaxID=2006109 RepID=UPI001315A22F|nr:peptidoglycan-binding protein [Luteimonas sp. 100069]